jgi:hypothetical protein
MQFLRFAVLVLVASVPVFGQLASNSVTITASRQLTATLDQTLVDVYVDAGLDKDLDDILRTVTGAGITKSNFVQVYSAYDSNSAPALEWQFTLTVPFSKLKSVLAYVTSIKQADGVALSFHVEGSQTSADAQPGCKYEDLVASAQEQAGKLAEAVRLQVGRIIGLSETPTDGLVPTYAFQTRLQFFIPSGAVVGGFINTGLFYLPSSPVSSISCSLTVTFQLLGAQ